MSPAFIGMLPRPRPRREPDFGQMLRVLRRERPERPVLFEFCLNERLYGRAIGEHSDALWGKYDFWRRAIPTHCYFGYDCLTVPASSFGFPRPAFERSASISLNDQPAFTDRAGFAAYAWPDPAAAERFLDRFAAELPKGMSLVPRCGSVLECAISLLGFDNLCMMLSDNPALAADVFDAIGSRMVRHCQLHAGHPAAGACCPSDDWGFKTQTMLSPQDMRKYVFPWHRRMVQAIHAAGKPAILHCCGQVDAVMDDIIDDMQYDAKHSFEDAIFPVEQAYARWGRRIAILGGIDVDFLCRSEPAAISQRARAMLVLSRQRGGYALGSGNSIPPYVPDEHFLAMIEPVFDDAAV